jgi:hypothetical protein
MRACVRAWQLVGRVLNGKTERKWKKRKIEMIIFRILYLSEQSTTVYKCANIFSESACITWALITAGSSPLVPADGTWRTRDRLNWKPPANSSNSNSMDGAWSRTWTYTGADARQSTFRGPHCSFFCSYSRARPRQPGPHFPTGWQNSCGILRCYTFTRTYCNEFAGSISQWKFITLKVQYTTLDYSSQLF